MGHYPDLAPCHEYGAQYAEAFRAVGWLGVDEAYPKGQLTQQEHRALRTLTSQDYAVMGMFGRHDCEFCGASLSTTDLFLPAGEEVLLAPGGILHYIDVHEYRPPDPFRKALLACPPLASPAYFSALLKTGWAPIARRRFSGDRETPSRTSSTAISGCKRTARPIQA